MACVWFMHACRKDTNGLLIVLLNIVILNLKLVQIDQGDEVNRTHQRSVGRGKLNRAISADLSFLKADLICPIYLTPCAAVLQDNRR